jgi:hypothetical protein
LKRRVTRDLRGIVGERVVQIFLEAAIDRRIAELSTQRRARRDRATRQLIVVTCAPRDSSSNAKNPARPTSSAVFRQVGGIP